VGAIWRFWELRGHFDEGRSRTAGLLVAADPERRTAARGAALNGGGVPAYRQGDYAAARALQGESLAIRRELGDRRGIALSLEGAASVAAATGEARRAARLWDAAERLREEIAAPLLLSDRSQHEEVAAARSALGDDAAFDAAWQEGRAMPLEQAIADALEGVASSQ
jgi:hypothetical protein